MEQTPNYNPATPPTPPQGGGNDLFATDRYGKSRGVAGLLAIFLGSLGIQYFYLGKTTAGVIALIGTWVLCGIPSILWLIQGILMLCMPAADFERKYEASPSTFPLF